MDNKINIREATEKDCTLILWFIRQIADFEKLSHQVEANEEDIYQSFFGKEAIVKAIIASIEKKPAGFVIYYHNFSTFIGRSGIYLEDIYVSPEHRGIGIGKALFQHVVSIARQHDAKRIEWSVLKWNTEAQTFYHQAGAKSLDEWTTYRMDEAAIASYN